MLILEECNVDLQDLQLIKSCTGTESNRIYKPKHREGL